MIICTINCKQESNSNTNRKYRSAWAEMENGKRYDLPSSLYFDQKGAIPKNAAIYRSEQYGGRQLTTHWSWREAITVTSEGSLVTQAHRIKEQTKLLIEEIKNNKNQLKRLKTQDVCFLEEHDFSGAIMSGDYRGISFLRINCQKAYLCDSDISSSDIRESCFEGSDLDRVQIRKARLIKCSFVGAIMPSCSLQESTLEETPFSGAVLQDSCLKGVVAVKASFDRAFLENADLRGNFSESNFSESKAPGVIGRYGNFYKANFHKADLQNADLRFADLRFADLSKADLQNADLRGANLQGANLQGANLQGAILSRANFRGADLSKAVLIEAVCLNSIFHEIKAIRANFRRSILQSANFNYADLTSANFNYADCKSARFYEAKLNHVNAKGCDIRNVDLRKTETEGMKIE